MKEKIYLALAATLVGREVKRMQPIRDDVDRVIDFIEWLEPFWLWMEKASGSSGKTGKEEQKHDSSCKGIYKR